MFKSLRFRLSSIVIGLAVGPLLLTATLLTWQSATYLEQQSQAMLHGIAVQMGNEIRSFIDDNVNQLFRIHKLHGIELLETDNQRSLLNNLMFDRQDFQDLALLNTEGQELMRLSRSIVYQEKDLQNRFSEKEYRVPAEQNQPYFGAIRFDTTIQEPLLTISVPIIDLRSGNLAYVLAGNLRLKKIWDLLAVIDVRGGGTVYVVDQTKKVVAHRNPSVVLRGTTINLSQASGRANGINGTNVIISLDLLKFGDQNFKIVAEQPISEAFALISNHFQIAVVITFLVIVMAISLIVAAIRHVVKPVKSLATAARGISNGEYSQHVNVTSQDEVGALASAFNKMSQDLGKYRNDMEGLVKIRTKELAQVNRQLERDLVERLALEKEREELIDELKLSLEKVKTLSGFLPICASCKKIRDDKGYWNQIESYIAKHSEAEFSHGVCPECAEKLYPELF